MVVTSTSVIANRQHPCVLLHDHKTDDNDVLITSKSTLCLADPSLARSDLTAVRWTFPRYVRKSVRDVASHKCSLAGRIVNPVTPNTEENGLPSSPRYEK